MQSRSFCLHDLWDSISLVLFNNHLVLFCRLNLDCRMPCQKLRLSAVHRASSASEEGTCVTFLLLHLHCVLLLITRITAPKTTSFQCGSLKEHGFLAEVTLIWDVKMKVRKAHFIFANWKDNVNGSLPWISKTVSTHQLETDLQFVMMFVIGNVSNGYWNNEVSLESNIHNTERYCINYTHQFCNKYFAYPSFEF